MRHLQHFYALDLQDSQLLASQPEATVAAGKPQTAPVVHYPTSWLRQFAALARRELTSVTRNPFDLAGRYVHACISQADELPSTYLEHFLSAGITDSKVVTGAGICCVQ